MQIKVFYKELERKQLRVLTLVYPKSLQLTLSTFESSLKKQESIVILESIVAQAMVRKAPAQSSLQKFLHTCPWKVSSIHRQ